MANFFTIDWKGNIVRETTLEEIVANLKQLYEGKHIDYKAVPYHYI